MSEQSEPETVVTPPAATDATSEWEPEPPVPGAEGQPVTASADATASAWTSGPEPGGAAAVSKLLNERPELALAGAFAGGIVIATILKRLAS